MLKFRCVFFGASLLEAFLMGTALAQTKPKPPYHVCHEPSLYGMAIGEIPDKPFVAEVIVRPVREDAHGTVEVLPGGPAKDGMVARDRWGVVTVKLNNLHPDEREPSSWSQTICEPSRGTHTIIWQLPQRVQPEVVVLSDFKPSGKLMEGTIDVFQREHIHEPNLTELSPAMFEGLKVSHFQWNIHVNGYVLDDWLLSDELWMHVADLRWKDDPKVGILWRMEHVRLVDPEKKLMQAPASAQTLPPSMVPPWIASPTGGPLCVPPMCGP